jgi:hypothetical protein
MKTIALIIGIPIFILSSACQQQNEVKDISKNDTLVTTSKIDSVKIDSISSIPVELPFKIASSYTDYWANEEDMGGTAYITFKKNKDGIYEGVLEQRFGMDGFSPPEQPMKNLKIMPDGKISFSVVWVNEDETNTKKTVTVTGKISSKQLTFSFNDKVIGMGGSNLTEVILDAL